MTAPQQLISIIRSPEHYQTLASSKNKHIHGENGLNPQKRGKNIFREKSELKCEFKERDRMPAINGTITERFDKKKMYLPLIDLECGGKNFFFFETLAQSSIRQH